MLAGICKGNFSTAKSSDQSAHKLKSENKIFRTTEQWVGVITVWNFQEKWLENFFSEFLTWTQKRQS